MAKVTGPLMSMSASGTVGKTATFSIWKGRPYVRHRVIPMNPKSTAQKTVRSVLGALAKACRAVLTSAKDPAVDHPGSAFFQAAVAKAPTGQSWISYLQKVLNAEFSSLVTAFGVLSSTIKGYYQTEAIAIGLADYVDKSGVTHTAGEQLYLLASYAVTYLAYTGFAAGIDEATSAQCLAFGTNVHTSA